MVSCAKKIHAKMREKRKYQQLKKNIDWTVFSSLDYIYVYKGKTWKGGGRKFILEIIKRLESSSCVKCFDCWLEADVVISTPLIGRLYQNGTLVLVEVPCLMRSSLSKELWLITCVCPCQSMVSWYLAILARCGWKLSWPRGPFCGSQAFENEC